MTSDRRTGGRLEDHPDQLRAAFGRARRMDACCRTRLCSCALDPTRVAKSSPLCHQRHRAQRAIWRSPNAHRELARAGVVPVHPDGSELEDRRCRNEARPLKKAGYSQIRTTKMSRRSSRSPQIGLGRLGVVRRLGDPTFSAVSGRSRRQVVAATLLRWTTSRRASGHPRDARLPSWSSSPETIEPRTRDSSIAIATGARACDTSICLEGKAGERCAQRRTR
jgi:hypothetical protein